MLKRVEIALAAVVGLALAVGACQPGSGGQPQAREGMAQVMVRGLSAYEIDRMVITAQPANVTQTMEYNADAGVFTGSLLLPAGEQTLTAEGYSYSYGSDGGFSDGGSSDSGSSDGGSSDGGCLDAGLADGGSSDAGPTDGGMPGQGTLVATGSATVTIVAGSSTAVTMRIHDITPPRSQGDIGPLLRSMTASSTTTTVGTPTQLEVDAVDLDGDALSYSWTSNCASSTFSNPFSATTSWSSSVSGVCRLSVTVSSRSLSTTEWLEVSVFSAPVDGGPGEGSVQVNGEYIPRPQIEGLLVESPRMSTFVHRSTSNATLRNVSAGVTYTLDMRVEYGTRLGTFSGSIVSDCGGTWRSEWNNCRGSGGYCSVAYSWTTPVAGTICKLTLQAANGTLADSFSIGVSVR
ncbi:hypothetical protein JQX13_03900 [Archangium violaceum]|uniref:hypothetical protein n=1 Tax=Archangium violaceum TaxID=83451 RepID=UPI00193B82BB|nr:hypothetical protein [Archangium violaceum]QRK09302.1 hypothetical protein JQX13_03900 [Archangium violaceum]